MERFLAVTTGWVLAKITILIVKHFWKRKG